MMRGFSTWGPDYLKRLPQQLKPLRDGEKRTAVIAICDHFEPFHVSDKEGALRRMDKWLSVYPGIADQVRDTFGRELRHTFFVPVEQHDNDVMDKVDELVRATQCEVEVHLHHGNDDEDSLRQLLETGVAVLSERGHLTTGFDGRPAYAFIHGNWALCNGRQNDKFCGVDDEIRILSETGCYVDMTMPAAPDPAQSRVVNRITRIQGGSGCRGYDIASELAAGDSLEAIHSSGDLLQIPGPLGWNMGWRKYGVIPRLENGDLTSANQPSPTRARMWAKLGVRLPHAPDTVFVKLHGHGAPEKAHSMFLGGGLEKLKKSLDAVTNSEQRWFTDYAFVTARQMTNVVGGLLLDPNASVDSCFDLILPKPAICQ